MLKETNTRGGNAVKKLRFKNGLCAGVKEILLDGEEIGAIFQRDDRKFWYVNPLFEYRGRLYDIYGDTLREVKEQVREALQQEATE